MPNEVVYKHAFIDGRADITMPASATVMLVAEQRGEPHIWIRLDAAARMTTRHFLLVGTGWATIKPHWPHVGSFMMQKGNRVFHAFEEIDDAK